jgi:hypothetical protein
MDSSYSQFINVADMELIISQLRIDDHAGLGQVGPATFRSWSFKLCLLAWFLVFTPTSKSGQVNGQPHHPCTIEVEQPLFLVTGQTGTVSFVDAKRFDNADFEFSRLVFAKASPDSGIVASSPDFMTMTLVLGLKQPTCYKKKDDEVICRCSRATRAYNLKHPALEKSMTRHKRGF